METSTRKDLLTGEEFIPKKISQRFASPANRIKFNNRKASLEKQKNAPYDKPLLKNYRILVELIGTKKSTIHKKDFMLGRGFNFSVFNNFELIDGRNYPKVNEFALIIDIENQSIKIIRND